MATFSFLRVNRSVAERLQTKYDSTMNDRILLWSMRQLKAISGEFTEDLTKDFGVLKQRLQVSAKRLILG